MKQITRIFTILLIFIMSVTCFVCAGESSIGTGTKQTEETQETQQKQNNKLVIQLATDLIRQQVKDYVDNITQIDQSAEIGLDIPFLYQIANPNYNYAGHTVDLNDSQYLKVLRSIFGEQEGGSFEIYVGLCQYIRDYIDYGSLPRSYDNLGEFWLIRGGTMPDYMNYEWFYYNVPDAIKAVEYVFHQGGSLAQGKMHFYVDDDDEALDGSYEAAYAVLVNASCGQFHYHDKIRLAPPDNPANWTEFNLD